MSDENNLPEGWSETDPKNMKDSPWGDNTSSDDEGDSSEVTPVSGIPPISGNTKLVMRIVAVVVALGIAFFGGMFVFDMFAGDGKSIVPTSNGINIGGTTEISTSEPTIEPTEETMPEPTEEPISEPTEKPDEWKSAYEKVMNGENDRNIVYNDGNNGIVDDPDMEEYAISLVDFDGSGIPTLVIHINGWEWWGIEMYTYHEGDVVYSDALRMMVSLFMEESSDRYISICSGEGDCWSRAYEFKNGKFVEVEDYTEVTGDWEDGWNIRIGSETYPVENIEQRDWSPKGFMGFDFSRSQDYKTALSRYLNGKNPQTAPTPSPIPPNNSPYKAVKADVTWWEAYNASQDVGGHLVTIKNEKEFKRVTKMANKRDIKVLWLGARRDGENSWDTVKWITGEDLTFTKWYPGEPSYFDTDGSDENVLSLIKANNKWYFNDSSEDVTEHYSGKIGYVIEYE